jgi:uncharacterized protein YggE
MNPNERFWKTSAAAVAVLTVFLVFLTIKEIKSLAYVGSNPLTNTITVDGSGEAVGIPDVATFSFTVTEEAKTVAEAQTKATTKSNSALQAVKDAGVAEKDIQTTSYNINPKYEYESSLCSMSSCRPSKSVLTGYQVSQSVQVKVRDLSKAGALFSTIGSLGVQNVDGLTFSVDQPDSMKAKARDMAIAKAQAKADDLAKSLGVRLVRIISFYEDNGQYPMYAGMKSAVMMDSAVVPAAVPSPEIAVGQQKITDRVTITYEIK